MNKAIQNYYTQSDDKWISADGHYVHRHIFSIFGHSIWLRAWSVEEFISVYGE